MKRSVVLKYKKVKLPSFSWKSIVLSVLLICGVIIGCICVKGRTEGLSSFVNDFAEKFIQSNYEAGFLLTAINFLEINITVLMVIFLLGNCSFGVPMIAFVVFAIGIICGMITQIYYNIGNMKGIGYCFLVILPGLSLFLISVIKCCESAINLSLKVFEGMYWKGNREEVRFTKKTATDFLPCLLICFISALLNSITILLFSTLFSFVG